MDHKAAEHLSLDQRVLLAHSDKDYPKLASLYFDAATQMEIAGDISASCFYLTQAYVYALEIDAPQLSEIYARLKVHGRV